MNTASRIGSSLGAYFRTLVQNAVISILLFIAGFAIAGVPWWFLTGFVCGIVNLIPHLGSVLDAHACAAGSGSGVTRHRAGLSLVPERSTRLTRCASRRSLSQQTRETHRRVALLRSESRRGRTRYDSPDNNLGASPESAKC